MSAETIQTETLLRQLMIDMARLPEDDLPLVAEFFQRLMQTRHHEAGKPPRASVAALRAEARRRAAQLGSVPREQLIDRFIQIMDEIRADAIARGAAIEGEWRGD